MVASITKGFGTINVAYYVTVTAVQPQNEPNFYSFRGLPTWIF